MQILDENISVKRASPHTPFGVLIPAPIGQPCRWPVEIVQQGHGKVVNAENGNGQVYYTWRRVEVEGLATDLTNQLNTILSPCIGV